MAYVYENKKQVALKEAMWPIYQLSKPHFPPLPQIMSGDETTVAENAKSKFPSVNLSYNLDSRVSNIIKKGWLYEGKGLQVMYEYEYLKWQSNDGKATTFNLHVGSCIFKNDQERKSNYTVSMIEARAMKTLERIWFC